MSAALPKRIIERLRHAYAWEEARNEAARARIETGGEEGRYTPLGLPAKTMERLRAQRVAA